MPGRSFRVGRIAGIPVGVSPWWLVIVALITWSLGASYFPEAVHGISPSASYALGLASALLLFASILAHEFGHAIVARRRGIEVEEIDLWLLGGVSRLHGDAHEPLDELRFALAGPAVTAVLAVSFGAATLLLPAGTPAAVAALVEYQALVNGLILIFNLMPAFPLDGGRVLRSLLWKRSGDIARATRTAAGVGRGFGYLLIVLGGLELLNGAPEGLWLGLIGLFIVSAARAEAVGAQVRGTFSGVRVRELMSAPAVSIPAEMSAARAVRDFFVVHRYASFPVVEESGRAIGLVTLAQVQALTPAQRERQPVGELATREPDVLVDQDEDVAELLQRGAFMHVGRAVAIESRGRPVGVVSITDVQRTLRAAALAQQPPGRDPVGWTGSDRPAPQH
ncbi:MAG TPA: site-2 protease family protein [Solirubrobacteraceae bacterium]|nr:site-2 protease family protein [Solirubrobacteraceae bacterium]